MTEDQLKTTLARRAYRAVVGGFRPPSDPFTSWFGSVRLALPNETWPDYNGKPMMPLCQFNLTELPDRPDNLADIALITLFIKQDDVPPFDTTNGDQWLLRAYPSLEGITVIDEPADRGYIKPFPIRWEVIDKDYPTWGDAASMELPQNVADNYHSLFNTEQGTKIGGWPFTVQSEISWAPWNQHPANPEYVSQIDSEHRAEWAWGDAGFGYFGRGTGDARDQWIMEWQCY